METVLGVHVKHGHYPWYSACVRERERERERDRQTDRQRERQTDRERDRQTERERERENVCDDVLEGTNKP